MTPVYFPFAPNMANPGVCKQEPEFIKKSIDKGIPESSWDKVQTFYTPKVYKEIYKELESEGQHETFIKHQIKNEEYKPLTQRIRGE